MNRKNGFTLAEIMISVVTLGIMAALLIPAIVGNKPNNNRVMFKKAYSTMEKAVQELINDDRYYPSDMVCGPLATDPCKCNTSTDKNLSRPAGSACGFAYKDITGMNIPADANTATKKFVYLLSLKLNTVGDINYTADSNEKIFTTTDGIDWYCDFADFNLSHPDFWADVNGEKGPNNNSSGDKNQDVLNLNVFYQGRMLVDDIREIDIIKNPLKNQN